ncbi:glycosyltransferase family 1 protein [Neobacillus novalis]|uniref:Glycosyltransferase family 1 protein n=1 Tax=Neobacillus novalis TaxID=220687 RepID=A0AA95ML01_9BACI|nr:glycosyltransferase family 1 protein [Neobacillus novalis]WHY85621.1 glycosyltransferase family 1 protein [Neobacillus novalis]
MTNRVLHVFTAMNVGGAETMILNLYRAIDREKIQFDFLVHTEEIGYYEQEIIALGGRIFRLPYPRMRYLSSYQQQLFELFSQNQFSAVHSHAHFFSGFILKVAKKASIPIRVAHSHTTSDGQNASIFRQLYRSYMKRNLRKNVTHRFGCSVTAGESLFGKNVETNVLPNSFNLQAYEQTTAKKESKPVDSIVIGHVGRFETVKNHSFFLEIFYHFKRNYPQASAVLVGDGPEKNKLEDLIEKYQLQDSVNLLGIRSDIPAIMSTFDIFLFPSIYEGLGNVVIEAQAAGVPCLVSDTVPKEVDLAMNLVTFKRLTNGAEAWAEELTKLIVLKERPSWDERERKLKSFGYDVVENAKFLEKLYSGY